MKTILNFALAASLLVLSACAHETTTMDRELALKLVDKTGKIEIVQTGGTPLLGPSHVPAADSSPAQGVAIADQTDTRTNCVNSPVYTVNGTFVNYVKHCFGGQ